MDNVTFNRQPCDIFARLANERPWILRSQAVEVMKLAFSHGAYVAGGFARVALKDPSISSEHAYDRIVSYLQSSESINRDRRHFHANRGDVDLFFPDDRSLKAFGVELNLTPSLAVIPRHQEPPRACFDLDCDDRVIVQVICGYLAPIEQQLRSFDLYNAMVAFNDKESIIPTEWAFLEEERMIHVVNWTSPYVINRICKWFYKHGMRKMTPKTADEIGGKALEIVVALRKEPVKMPWGTLTSGNVVNRLHQFLPMLTNEELIKLMALYPPSVYNGAFHILRKRAQL